MMPNIWPGEGRPAKTPADFKEMERVSRHLKIQAEATAAYWAKAESRYHQARVLAERTAELV